MCVCVWGDICTFTSLETASLPSEKGLCDKECARAPEWHKLRLLGEALLALWTPQILPSWPPNNSFANSEYLQPLQISISLTSHPPVILILRVMQACNGIRGILRALSGFGAQPNPPVWEFKWFSIYMENLDDDDDYYGKGLNYLFQTEFLLSQLLGDSCDSNLLPPPFL